MAAAKEPSSAVKKALDDSCLQMAEIVESRKNLNADMKELKKLIEETMIAAGIKDWEHAGVELSISESLKIKPPAAKKDDDEG